MIFICFVVYKLFYLLYSLSKRYVNPAVHVVLGATEMGSARVVLTSPVKAQSRFLQRRVTLHRLCREFFLPRSVVYGFALDRVVTLIRRYKAVVALCLIVLNARVAIAKDFRVTLVRMLFYCFKGLAKKSFMSVVHDLVACKLGFQPILRRMHI